MEEGRKSRSNMLLSWTHLIKNSIPTPHHPHGILEPTMLTGGELAAPPSLSETSVTRKHSHGHPHLPHPTQYSCSNFKDKFMSLSSWTEFSNKRNLESLMQNICKLSRIQIMAVRPVNDWVRRQVSTKPAGLSLIPGTHRGEGENGLLLTVCTMAHECMCVCAHIRKHKSLFNVTLNMTLKTCQLSIVVWNIHFLWARLGSLILGPHQWRVHSIVRKEKWKSFANEGRRECAAALGGIFMVRWDGKLILDEKIWGDSYWKMSELK